MATYFVDNEATGDDDGSTWENAYTTIAAALAVAVSGDTVKVRVGVYTVSARLEVPAGVDVYGGFPRTMGGTTGTVTGRGSTPRTVIDGASTYGGIQIESDTTFDGFLIRNCADTNGAGVLVDGTYEGSELLTDGDMEAVGTSAWTSGSTTKETSSPIQEGSQSLEQGGTTYQAVLVSGHTYRVTGYAYESNSYAPVLAENGVTLWTHSSGAAWEAFDETFTATGTQLQLTGTAVEAPNHWDDMTCVEVFDSENIVLTNFIIRDCAATSSGGGIYTGEDEVDIEISEFEIHDCSAVDYGGAIRTHGATISDGYIHDNSAQYGGGVTLGSNTDIINCVVVRNDAEYYGGVRVVDDNVSITNCDVSDNTVDNDYGGIGAVLYTVLITNCTVCYNEGAGVLGGTGTTIVNSVLWGNDPLGGYQIAGTIAGCTYSNVQFGYSGTGNVTGEPVFREEGKYYYALDAICDAVDSANSGATNYEATDILGNDRYDHPGQTDTGVGTPDYVDMGAYEFQGVPEYAMDMSGYYVNMDYTLGTNGFYLYAVVRLPEMPSQFSGLFGEEPVHVRCQITSEVEKDESDNSLYEWHYVDGNLAAYRLLTSSVTATDPTRDVAWGYSSQSEESEYIAEDKRYPSGQYIDAMPHDVGQFFRYAIVKMVWNPTADSDGNRWAYNVDITQIHDHTYASGGWDDFSPEMHPGGTVFAPDVPVSAAHIRLTIDSLIKLLYETVFAQSIPVFGQHSTPVV